MTVLRRFRPALILAACAAIAPAVLAADPAAAPAGSPEISDRLFLAFAQDAALVPSQWWEGQIEYADGKNSDPNTFIVRGVVAFHPIKKLEVGGWVGFGDASAPAGISDGSGATDLNAYVKWVFPNVGSNLDLAAGVLMTVPTGDDTAGLGYNSFGAQIFGGLRYRTPNVVWGGHVGVRYNGDGAFQGHDLSGKTSVEVGASAIFPLANQVSIIAEANLETQRFDNDDPGDPVNEDIATQVLAGVDWKAFGRGRFRFAVGAGLTDAAPNFRVLLGYAYTF